MSRLCKRPWVARRAPEGVDRLLGVADHEQAGVAVVLADAVDAFENTVLDRVGVLEFIDHRHRELLTDQSGQSLACLAVQCLLQPQEHVVEPHLRAAPLLHFELRRNPAGGMFE